MPTAINEKKAQIASSQDAKRGAPAMDAMDPKLVIDLTKQAFYKKYFGALLMAVLVLTCSNVMLAGGFIWAKNQKVDRQYFSTEQGTGRFTRILPMSEPHLDDASLSNWVRDCVTETNTYDFVNYQKQLMVAKGCYTDSGWEQFEAALAKAGTLDTVKKERLVASAVVTGAPVVLQQGMFNGAYAWQMQLPMTVTYQGGSSGQGVYNQNVLLKILVVNVPSYVSKEAVGIAQYIATER
jgi:intracellular multiplication protein IcmL